MDIMKGDIGIETVGSTAKSDPLIVTDSFVKVKGLIYEDESH